MGTGAHLETNKERTNTYEKYVTNKNTRVAHPGW
jgi:hypothetical protein